MIVVSFLIIPALKLKAVDWQKKLKAVDWQKLFPFFSFANYSVVPCIKNDDKQRRHLNVIEIANVVII